MNPLCTYQEILDYIDTFDVVAYGHTRNHLTGGVSKLSPYITRGVIDLPTIRDRVLTRYSYSEAAKFIQELAWREYFQKVWAAKGDAIFSDLRFPRTDWAHFEIIQAHLDAATGITVIDAALDELFQTGYMHNHARLWTAMLACNVGKAHWFEMGRFLYYHLLDGDLASNMLSWQWVAGTSSSKRYVANQSLINVCSANFETNTYLDHDRKQVGTGSIPAPLLAHTPFPYTMSYPNTDTINDLTLETIYVYHPWGLDPLWRAGEPGQRILVIEPRVFDRFPISPQVMDFIVTVARTHIPGIKIFVGNVESIPGITKAAAIYSKTHPTTKHWPGTTDTPRDLFPTVTGYFPSFFAFWQTCEKQNSTLPQ